MKDREQGAVKHFDTPCGVTGMTSDDRVVTSSSCDHLTRSRRGRRQKNSLGSHIAQRFVHRYAGTTRWQTRSGAQPCRCRQTLWKDMPSALVGRCSGVCASHTRRRLSSGGILSLQGIWSSSVARISQGRSLWPSSSSNCLPDSLRSSGANRAGSTVPCSLSFTVPS